MNLLILTGLGAVCLLVLWLVQSVALLWHGEPLALPLRHRSQIPAVRWTVRITVQIVWVSILLGFPLAIGQTPLDYYRPLWPEPRWGQLLAVFGISMSVFAVGFAVELAVGWIRIWPQLDPKTRRRKLFRRLFSPFPIAILEETIFRGILLEQLDRAFPATTMGTCAAIVISACVFSSLHFLRPYLPMVSNWQAATGLLLVGCLLGLAYVAGGHSLWLPVTIHAAGILVTETMKLYTHYDGHPLLIGSSVFPHCGLVGMTFLLVLSTIIVTFFSTPTAWIM